MRRAARNLFPLLFAGLMGLGSAQAGGFGDVLKGLLKEKVGGGESQQALATPPQQGGQDNARPETQLLSALLKGNTSQEEEVRIGRRIAGNLLGAAPLVKDPALQQYVNNVGRWVSLQSERPGLPWRFGVIESEDINAFAAPGGYIFLTKGLYRRLGNEAELAGVLGHEIGHVIRKHHLKLLQQSQAIAALGSLFGSKLANEDQLIQNLIGNGAEVVARGLDKEAEYEADRIGVVLTARAGYDTYALPTVLAEIGHVAKGDKRVSLLFKTHPHPEERLGRLAEAVGSHLDNVPEGQSVANRFYRLR
ncbi:MAG: M48 family metalloprotease [Thiobacillus sp.]|nr:M48 family metalloprotease [Thiobacillus sp.]